MNRALRWTEHAVEDLSTIAEYISLSSPIAAEQLVERVKRQLEQISAYPESGRMVPEVGASDIRELQVKPYRVIYRVLIDQIEVISIVHGRRDFKELPQD